MVAGSYGHPEEARRLTLIYTLLDKTSRRVVSYQLVC